MIGRLRGRVIDDEGDGTLVIDVGGVGYEVVAPLGTLGRVEADADGLTVLFFHTYVREDQLVLFGFATMVERVAFRTLIGISKVGPKLALAVLGSVTVSELATLVATGQVGMLTKVPGVGKKTAERIILELEGKLSAPTATSAAPKRAAPAGDASKRTVLAEALVRMGFKGAEAERAVGSVDDLDRPMGELIRDALAILSP
ncbi:MAG: Holliday junction branch migration protein RuvA [Polyangiaceae bacterium]